MQNLRTQHDLTKLVESMPLKKYGDKRKGDIPTILIELTRTPQVCLIMSSPLVMYTLMESMPASVHAVIKDKGGHTKRDGTAMTAGVEAGMDPASLCKS